MLQKILVPLDGSELADAVLPYVQEISQRCEPDPAEVILLQVVALPAGHTAAVFRPIDSDFPSRQMPDSTADLETVRHPIYREQEMASLRSKVEASLLPQARLLREAGINTRVDVAFGRPAEVIVSYPEREGVDLITMCTHGRSGVSRWILGSVADKVLRGTHSPALSNTPSPPQPEIKI